MRSLRSRLLTVTAVGMVTVLVLAWGALYLLLRRALVDEFDRASGEKVRSLAALVEREEGRVELEFDEGEGLEEFRRATRPEYFQVWLASGREVSRSRSLGSGPELAPSGGPEGQLVCRAMVLPDGRPGRSAGLVFHPRADGPAGEGHPSAEPLTLVVARDTVELERTLARAGAILAGVGALATLLTLVLLRSLIGRGLRPVEEIAERIRGVRDDISARIEVARAPAEVALVQDRLNGLLGRLEAAFERERAFSSDVAHELRTPIAGLRTTLEVVLAGGREPESLVAGAEDALAICVQMQSVVDGLLSLARLEAGQLAVERELIDVDELLDTCQAAFEARARRRGLRVERTSAGGLSVRSDPEKLRLIIRILLDNAVSHSDAGGHVRAEASEADDGSAEIVIANSGSRLSAEEAGRVFDRFWRGDASRSETGVHCGLGLSLARKVAEVLGAEIRVRSELDGEFVVTLRVPADASTSP